MSKHCDKYNRVVLKHKNQDVFIVFYSKWCPYSIDAMNTLRTHNRSYKGYNIDKFKGGLDKLLYSLKKQAHTTQFNKNHRTRPIVFWKGNFIGGCDDLQKFLM